MYNDRDQNQQQQQDQEPALESTDAQENEQGQRIGTATYSPEDNKLRLYPFHRLDADVYARLKDAGFKWAPRQELFVAPMWTPGRADILAELCGEIGDEDTSLVERAEERADRFGEYSEKRAQDANAARAGVDAIAQRFEFGQPILVGHHSERKARKDAERITTGMRRAVKMWETSTYWQARAEGAKRHAKYKELPGVRARRIKKIEADKRKQTRSVEESEKFLKLWQREGLTMEQATSIAGLDHLHVRTAGDRFGTSLWSLLDRGERTAQEAATLAVAHHSRNIARCQRWIAHYDLRLGYEGAMLSEGGGLAADRFDIQPGGRVLVDGEWLTVIRVNKSGGKAISVTTNARYVRCRGIEQVRDYQAPDAADVAKVKAATKLPPIVNYPGEGFIEFTAAEWKRKPADYKATRRAPATETTGAYRYRTAFAPGGGYRLGRVYITDQKRVDPPPAAEVAAALPPVERVLPEAYRKPAAPAVPNEFDQMRQQLRDGVQVVVAPQLFPTPVDLAARMVALAGIEPGHDVLEPSAGTGRILEAISEAEPAAQVVAVEIVPTLIAQLGRSCPNVSLVGGDFLAIGGALGPFDRVIMNPPFERATDIAHIQHAFGLLKPGGVLVALCANGPRQSAQLRPLVERCGGEWEELPADTFKESGTAVRTVLLTLHAPD